MKYYKAKLVGVLTGLAMTALAFTGKDKSDEKGSVYEGLEFSMPRIQEPDFPGLEVNILDFGAIPNGLDDNTQFINQAIRHVSEKGGGKVVIPRGIWSTGPIALQNNVNLHTESGAVVIFSTNFDDYPLIATSFEGLDTYRCTSPISGRGLENIAITGNGVFDGSGHAWRPVKKGKLTATQWKQLVKSGGVLSEDGGMWYPSEMSRSGDSRDNFNVPDFETKEEFEAVKDFLRPVLLSLVKCKKVLIDGPTFQNSPAWNLHPLMCEDITIRNLTVRNPWYSQNGDGVDLESCKNAIITNCNFDVGDDAICFKSGKNEDGWERAMPTENVIVKNNIVYHGHGGFVIGSEMSGGMKNIHISDCTFIGTDCGLRFKSTRGRGGVVENIYISNINMVDIPAEAIRFNMFYGGESPVAPDGQTGKQLEAAKAVPVSVATPVFKNIYLKNITATGVGVAAFFQGLPEKKLENVRLENVLLEARQGITMIDVSGIEMDGINVTQEKGPSLTVYNGNNINISNYNFDTGQHPVVNVLGNESSDIRLSGAEIGPGYIHLGQEVSKKAVVFNK